MSDHRIARMAVAIAILVGGTQLRCDGLGPACEEALDCCQELAPTLAQACEDAIEEARGESDAEQACEVAVSSWQSRGLCGGDSRPVSEASCDQLRTCCQQLGQAAGSCLATLNSLVDGPRPGPDCASALAGFTEAESCSVAGAPGPESSGVVCSDGIDNDGDGHVDCRDYDCAEHCSEICNDGVDNDGDQAVDCMDPDCATLSSCANGSETGWDRCHDGIDNDGDGFIDCNGGNLGGNQVAEDYDCTQTPGSC